MEVLSRELNGKTSKIDMCRVKKFVESFEKDSKEAFQYIENLIVLETVLSASQSPESTNRVKNLIRAFRPGASLKEEHEALVSNQFRTVQCTPNFVECDDIYNYCTFSGIFVWTRTKPRCRK